MAEGVPGRLPKPAAKRATNSKAKRYCFTVNNYEALLPVEYWMEHESPKITYVIYQEEIGEQGTPHLQGYLECETRQRFTALHNLTGLEGAHFIIANGSAKQNQVYCSKDDNEHPMRLGGPYEYGTPDLAAASGQGQRSDLLRLKRVIDTTERVSREKLYEDDNFSTFVRHEKSFLNYARFRSARRTTAPLVFLFVGTTGAGKSRTAFKLAQYLARDPNRQDQDIYRLPPPKGSGTYWDDYDNQTSVIIDEMDGNRMTPTFLNELLDRYSMVVPVHGSAGTNFNSPFIFITSNYLPRYWWRKHRQLDALYRRISCVINFVIKPNKPARPTVVYNALTMQFEHKN